MSNSDFQHLAVLFNNTGHFQIEFEQLFQFALFASQLRNDILLMQPISFDFASGALPILSPAIIQFLAKITSIPVDLIPQVWLALGPSTMCSKFDALLNMSHQTQLYERFGHLHGIGESISIKYSRESLNFILAYCTLYPPSFFCSNRSCRHHQIMLRKSEARAIVLFTVSGAIPAWSVHLYCEREFNLLNLFSTLNIAYRLQSKLSSQLPCCQRPALLLQ